MKKTFPLKMPGRADARVVEAVKHEARKYVQRERRKPLPEGFSRWNFLCQAGADAASASPCELAGLGARIDEIAGAGGDTIYLEIIAAPGHRTPPDDDSTTSPA
jgi:hypothetical protein